MQRRHTLVTRSCWPVDSTRACAHQELDVISRKETAFLSEFINLQSCDLDLLLICCLQFPLLYQEGVQNVLFSWLRILSWALNGAYNAIIVFFLASSAFRYEAFREGGEVAERNILGTAMYTCIVWIVNCQMALSVNYFTWIQHLFIWGSIAIWYLFLLIYGSMAPTISTGAYKILIEACGPAPSFWLVTFLVLVSALIPYVVYSSIQMKFFPMYHEIVQRTRLDRTYDDPEYSELVRSSSSNLNTVGFTARREAKANSKRKLHENKWSVRHLSYCTLVNDLGPVLGTFGFCSMPFLVLEEMVQDRHRWPHKEESRPSGSGCCIAVERFFFPRPFNWVALFFIECDGVNRHKL